MGTIAQHRAGIKANLETTFTDSTVRDHESKQLPAGLSWVVSWPDTFDPSPTQGSERTLVYSVRFEVPWDDDESSDNALETAMQTCVAAIEVDRTLGSSCDDAICLPFINIGAARRADETVVMMFTVPVEVFD